MARAPNTPRGGHYQDLVAVRGEGPNHMPGPHERRLGDLLDPRLPGRMVDLVNGVTRQVGMDAAAWRLDRLLHMAAALAQEPDRPPMPDA